MREGVIEEEIIWAKIFTMGQKQLMSEQQHARKRAAKCKDPAYWKNREAIGPGCPKEGEEQ